MKTLAFVLIFFNISDSRADPGEYCSQILEAKSGIKHQGKISIIRDMLRLRFAPGKLVSLKHDLIPVPTPLRVHLPDQTQAPLEGRNVIFSIDPPRDILNKIDLTEMRARLERITDEIRELNPLLFRIAQSDSLEECLDQVKEIGFDFDRYIRLIKEKTKLQIVGQVDEGELADQVIKKTLGKLHLNWEVIHSTDMSEVHSMLGKPGIQNVVLLSHGISEGKLVDSRVSEYPLGFFTALSPGIRSITIFSCYGARISENYRIKEHLGSTLSEFGNRHLFISIGTKIGGMDEAVPVKAFRSFMRRVDQVLTNEIHGAVEEPAGEVEQPRSACGMRFEALKIIRGTLGFILNGKFIGSANEGNGPLNFSYPCSFIDREKNILTIRNLGLLENADIESTQYTISPIIAGKTIDRESLSHYWREDKSYQGSKYEFSLLNIIPTTTRPLARDPASEKSFHVSIQVTI